jgi:hypothetical protein
LRGSDSPTSAPTEEYDGSTWTTGGTLATLEEDLGGAGIQTAALAFGGSDGTASSSNRRI